MATNAAPKITGSAIYNISPNWHGFSAIKYVVVFGASYSAVRRNSYKKEFSHPVPGQPLGIEFPGETFAEPGKPNWVGHLISKHAPHGEMLAYCYAMGGAMVGDVNTQIRDTFPLEVGKKVKSDWAPPHWDSTNTLFITWVGINDCAFGGDIETKMVALETAQHHLYAAGARNFLFVDLPPIERSPGLLRARRREQLNNASTTLGGPKALDRSQIFKTWNEQLGKSVRLFANSHPNEITAMIYSSHGTFTRVLDAPESHGFALEDTDKKGGGIWRDDLHPTSAMHNIIAKDIARLLEDQAAFVHIGE